MNRTFRTTLGVSLLALLPLSGAAMADTATEHEPNRLSHETSPYLLQHAHNPVDWYPWGPEAFEAARARNVPILLSVGYSTCYWCHVMERECFENPEVARIMNEGYVCIKLDREERPDIDEIYMTALQLLTRSGGWPMNMFLTPPGASGPDDPGLKPFYGGTYFPAEERAGMTSFPRLLGNISNAWISQRESVLKQADEVTEAVRLSVADQDDPVRIDQRQISQAFAQLSRSYDSEWGGFGAPPNYAPKFPQPAYLDFFLDTMHTLDDPAMRDFVNGAVRTTLDRMALGGIHDQVGGGFHRYSTDRAWVVPHFEKMLYDNAQLASLYAKAYMRGRDAQDARVLRDTLDYVLREMTDDSGLFYSAQDAEVSGHEGQNYVWSWAQLEGALGADDAAFAAEVYGVKREGGNFIDPHHREDGATNILVLQARPDVLAERLGMDLPGFLARKQAIDETLYEARSKRPQPALDDKVITAWNGLMIAGFADGAMALGDETYLDAAEKAAKAVLQTMRAPNGDLLRTSRHGVAKTPAFLEDYAYFIKGLLALHRTSAASGRADLTYINAAHDLTRHALSAFADSSGALYDTRPDQPDLIVRTRSVMDGALPSPISVMVHNLLDLYEFTQDEIHMRHVVEVMRPITSDVRASPVGSVNSVRALYRLLRIDASAANMFGPAEQQEAGPLGAADPVSILAPGERILLMEGQTKELPIRIEIAPGHHINAHDPGVEGLVPLEFRVVGSEAVRLEVDYPAGEAYAGAAVPKGVGPLMVHTGAIELKLRLSRTGAPWSGAPLIEVTYQVCTDTACLQPRTVELDIAMDN